MPPRRALLKFGPRGGNSRPCGGDNHVRTDEYGGENVDSNSLRPAQAALLTVFKEKRPIPLLVSNEYKLFPFDLGAHCKFVVLGAYYITQAWKERITPHNAASQRTASGLATKHTQVETWKFAFQWIEAQGPPWWLQPSQIAPNSPLGKSSKTWISSCPDQVGQFTQLTSFLRSSGAVMISRPFAITPPYLYHITVIQTTGSRRSLEDLHLARKYFSSCRGHNYQTLWIGVLSDLESAYSWYI